MAKSNQIEVNGIDFCGKKRTILMSLFCIIIVMASWFFNMGWLRFFMTIILIPFIHAVVFFLTNFFAAKYFDKSTKIKKLNLWFIVSYIIAYLLMSDGGDIGEMYFFFGLIHSNKLFGMAYFLSFIAFVGNINIYKPKPDVYEGVNTKNFKNGTLYEEWTTSDCTPIYKDGVWHLMWKRLGMNITLSTVPRL